MAKEGGFRKGKRKKERLISGREFPFIPLFVLSSSPNLFHLCRGEKKKGEKKGFKGGRGGGKDMATVRHMCWPHFFFLDTCAPCPKGGGVKKRKRGIKEVGEGRWHFLCQRHHASDSLKRRGKREEEKGERKKKGNVSPSSNIRASFPRDIQGRRGGERAAREEERQKIIILSLPPRYRDLAVFTGTKGKKKSQRIQERTWQP